MQVTLPFSSRHGATEAHPLLDFFRFLGVAGLYLVALATLLGIGLVLVTYFPYLFNLISSAGAQSLNAADVSVLAAVSP